MTTAHRPTWKAAVGRANEGGWSAGGAVSTQTSALDAPAHLSLKERAEKIDKKAALKKSLLALEEAEGKKHNIKRLLPKRTLDPAVEERAQQRLLQQTAEVDEVKLKEKYDDSDADDGGGSDDDSSDLDADDSDLDNSSSDSDDDDDEDDEEALQAELARIRAEREEARRKKEAQEAEEEQAKEEESALMGNPLLATDIAAAGGGRMKRRWNDDVVFRNQAKGEPAPKKRFINDTIRNDFHKRFLNKFIR